MNTADPNRSAQIQLAYDQYTLATSLRNSKVACILVVVLMPIGFLLDYCVFPSQAGHLFQLRLLTSAFAALVWVGLCQPGLPDWFYRVLAPGWYIVPAFFISWMIFETNGASSPYYAGLNLVILAVSSVIQASLVESVLAISIIWTFYLIACFTHSPPRDFQDWRMFVNNCFFIFYTCAIVVTGNFYYNRLRFREFALRFELDHNKKQLEESNRKLLQLDEAKSRFFANISHELRTPLTLLLAPLESLLSRARYTLEGPVRDLLTTMQSNGMRLLKLINDLLDLVRLDSGIMQINREPICIADFLKGLASAARQMAEDKNIHLETQIAPEINTVLVDRDKLEKIILNLQFNALKFTPAGGRVILRALHQNDQLVLQVADTGMGIPAKNLPHVFDRFWQADDSARRKYQGVGIGLALVKELAEVQDGSVHVESQEGLGTTFTVQLPFLLPSVDTVFLPTSHHLEASVRPPEATETTIFTQPSIDPSSPLENTVSNPEWISNLYRRAELFPSINSVRDSVRPVETSASEHDPRPRVLVADDEPDMLRFLKSQLSDAYLILEAVDGLQAVEKAVHFLPDVILMDMMMPEKDGLQASKEIRQRPATQNIPIILLTARADEETKLAALEAGASDFLPKPFSTTELQVRIRNLVDLYKIQRQLAQQNLSLATAIDQLKDTESKLVQNEKLASLGRLSAGIIHEINNPLNFATTGLYTLHQFQKSFEGPDSKQFAETLNDIEEGITRVKAIVSDLRSFSHHDEQQRDQVSIAQAVQASLRFLSHEWHGQVRVEQQIPAHLTVWANKNRLIQVLVNLLQNSLDAMRRKSYHDDTPTLRIEAREDHQRCHLVIRDNGEGIPANIMDKIFDPFFTTKDVGEGMGLGLSICYRIVQDLDGHISVKSEPGHYCEFTLTFPLKQTLAA